MPIIEGGEAGRGRPAGGAAPAESVRKRPAAPLVELFLAFLRVGVFGFGGGPAMIPLIRAEAVTTNRWVDDDEFMEVYAVASSLPGPIATNLAGYFGRKRAGLIGSLTALLGLTLPSGVAIVLLGGLYQATKDSVLVQDALAGIRPVVIALLVGVAVDFAPRALASGKGKVGVALRSALVLLAFLVAAFTAVHPAPLIAAGAVVGLSLRGRW